MPLENSKSGLGLTIWWVFYKAKEEELPFQKYHVQLHNNYAFMGNFPKLKQCESNHYKEFSNGKPKLVTNEQTNHTSVFNFLVLATNPQISN